MNGRRSAGRHPREGGRFHLHRAGLYAGTEWTAPTGTGARAGDDTIAPDISVSPLAATPNELRHAAVHLAQRGSAAVTSRPTFS
jgi:hypothetical protein